LLNQHPSQGIKFNPMLPIDPFIRQFSTIFKNQQHLLPWEIVNNLSEIINDLSAKLGEDYYFKDEIAIHKTAHLEQGAVLKGPMIISQDCRIAANTYLRGPVFLGKSVKVGPGSEIKQSIIFENSALAHFNYIGNSIIGADVNFEAGSICANHYNERQNKSISVYYDKKIIQTNTEKFGALVGDGCKIGANAVLSPGTILDKNTVVKRLELVDQCSGL